MRACLEEVNFGAALRMRVVSRSISGRAKVIVMGVKQSAERKRSASEEKGTGDRADEEMEEEEESAAQECLRWKHIFTLISWVALAQLRPERSLGRSCRAWCSRVQSLHGRHE